MPLSREEMPRGFLGPRARTERTNPYVDLVCLGGRIRGVEARQADITPLTCIYVQAWRRDISAGGLAGGGGKLAPTDEDKGAERLSSCDVTRHVI